MNFFLVYKNLRIFIEIVSIKLSKPLTCFIMKRILSLNCDSPSRIKKIVTIFSSAFILSSTAVSQTDIYFNDRTDKDSSYINNPANWYTDSSRSQVFTGEIDGSQNAYIYSDSTNAYRFADNSTLSFDTLTLETTPILNYVYIQLFIMGNDTSLKVNNLVTNINLAKVDKEEGKYSVHDWELYDRATLTVENDWEINGRRNGAKDWIIFSLKDVGNGSSINVKGNLYSGPKTDSNFIFSTMTSSITVEGAVDLENNVWNLSTGTTSDYVMRNVGGFGDANSNGISNIRLNIATLDETLQKVVDLNLTNKSAYDATANFTMKQGSASKLNIIMNGDALNGKQTLRFNSSSSHFVWDVNCENANINNVEVYSGRLDIAMYDGMKGNNLSLYSYDGNNSHAVFSAAGTSMGSDIGTVEFDSMTFYRGTLLFDLAEGVNDFIRINGTVTKESPSAQLVFDLNISRENLEICLDAWELDMLSWNLMSFKTEGSDISLSDVIVKTQAGIEGTLDFIEDLDSGLTTIKVDLGLVVPEPSDFAAIFALVAIAYAVYRKRNS